MKVSLDSRYFINQNSGFLGYMGEIDSREIIFEDYEVDGADAYKLRISYSDGVQYDISISDGKCVIHPSLLREVGFVELQVLAVAYSDGDFTYIKKSNVFKAEVKESLTGDTEPIPTYEEAVGALEKVLDIEDSASKSADRAEEAATKAENAVGMVEEYSETAKTAAENAGNSETKAKEYSSMAEGAVSRVASDEAMTKSYLIQTNMSMDMAKNYAESANDSAENAENSANSAAESVTEASKQVDLAKAEVTKAQGFSESAESYAKEAENSATKAKEYADNAETYSNSAQSAKSEAETAQKAAETSASEAADSLTATQTAAENAVQSAKLAGESADKAESAETSASNSAENAKNYADSAAESETSAKASAESAKAVADSIPEDYSELSSDVASIKSELDEQIPLTKLESVTGVMSYFVKVLRNKIINSTGGTWAIRDGDDDVYLFSKGLGFVVNDNSPTLEVYSETLKTKNSLGATYVRNIASISDDIYLAVNKTGLHTLDFDFTNDSKIPYTNKDLEQLPITNFATYAYGSGINTYGENRINCFAPFRLNGSVATENINGYTIYNTDGSIARSASGGKTISANDEIVVIFTQTPDTAKIEFAKETYEYSKYECSVFGDSLTADAPYYPYLATLTDLQIKNCGKGGSRVSGSASTCMNNDARINTLEGNFIVIMGGTNDCQTASVGEVSMSNCDIDTFVGAYNTMLSKIYYRYGISDGYYSDIDYSGVTKLDEAVFPNIILVTPPKAFASENQYQKLGEFGEYVKQIAKMWGLPCVDAYNNMQMSWANTSEFFDDISKDGTHYNSKGCSKLASLIANKFNECYANFNSQN